MEVANGWYEVLRGPRPPSVRWPVVPRGQPSRRQSQPRPQSRPQSKNPPARQTTPKSDPVQRPSPMRSSPDVATEAARAKVTAFEAAISALGSADEADLKSLHEALQKAKQSAHVPPIGERWDACHQFIERAKKRLAKADENLLKLQTERTQLATELAGTQGASSRKIRVDGRTPRRSQDSHGCGDVGHTVGTHGSTDRRCRQQTTSR